jgi:glycosyltransferase involved in cell wall biosynthesis
VGVIGEEPFDSRSWSGSSPYFFGALQERGVLRHAISAELPQWKRRVYQALAVQGSMAAWRYRFNLDTRYYAAMTRQAARALRELDGGFDVVLQIGAWYDMTKATDRPVCSYHDGSLATLIRSPYRRPQIARRHVDHTLAYERDLYSKMRFVFPMSSWLATSFINDNGVPASRVVPVGAGINLPRIRPTEGRTYDEPNILFVGKDFARKGGPDLFKALAIVRREIPAATLTVVGPSLADVPPGVRCIGPLSKADPAQLERLLDEYQRASVFVMPSLYEPFGIVFAEAMAHRLPCIGTNICAMPEIIAEGRSGYVVPPASPDALAGRLLDLLKDPARCREFGEAGYRRYQSKYTWQAVVGQICDALGTI